MLRHVPLLFLFAVFVRAEVTPGELLMAEMNCVACHTASDDVKARLSSRPSPVLGRDGVNASPEWLRDFLADPQKTKPGTLMPDRLGSVAPEKRAEVIESLVHFLVSSQGPQKMAVSPDAAMVTRGERLYHAVGCVQCHAPFVAPAGHDEEMAQVAAKSVPLAGPGIGKKYSVAELAAFLKDPLKSRPGGRMPSMNLSAGEAEAIAAFLLRDEKAGGAELFIVDKAKAEAGAFHFAALQCANCHAGVVAFQPAISPPAAKQIGAIRPRQMSGCLAPRPKGNAAKYELTERQKTVILAALKSQEILALPLTPEQQIRRKMTALNCFACHSRDRRGGITGLHLEYLPGREILPPKLSGVGSRLATDVLQEILATGKKTRAELPLRMPVFGNENTKDLPALFQQADGGK